MTCCPHVTCKFIPENCTHVRLQEFLNLFSLTSKLQDLSCIDLWCHQTLFTDHGEVRVHHSFSLQIAKVHTWCCWSLFNVNSASNFSDNVFPAKRAKLAICQPNGKCIGCEVRVNEVSVGAGTNWSIVEEGNAITVRCRKFGTGPYPHELT